MATSSDYSGRTVDLTVLNIDPARIGGTGVLPAPMTIPNPTTMISGVQKSVQAFVSLLFTREGSSRNRDLGCGFLAAATEGKIRTELDLRNYFSGSVSKVLTQMNRDTIKDDETIVTAVLESAVVERSRISMRIRVTTAAGASAVVLVPIES